MAVIKYRASDGTIKTVGEMGASVSSVNNKTGAITGVYMGDNPPPYPVTSVMGQTGAVTGLYNASNPPPYPVTSVMGKTGAVTGLYNADNPPPYPVQSVQGKTGVVQIFGIISATSLPTPVNTYPICVLKFVLSGHGTLGVGNSQTYRLTFDGGNPIPIGAGSAHGAYDLQCSVGVYNNRISITLTNHAGDGSSFDIDGEYVLTFIPNGATSLTAIDAA